MNNLAIIPARSGSKGLPDKNVSVLCGKPLMAWSIEAALSSGIFSDVVVSTDSERYANIAREWGASVPFLRSGATSTDSASSWDVVREVLECYRGFGESFDSVCLLQPTSPLRTAEDIVTSYGLFESDGYLPVVSVCEPEHSPLWCALLDERQKIERFVEGGFTGRRQDSQKYYRLNGAIYFVETRFFAKYGFSYAQGCRAYVMDQNRSVDIDTELDLTLAELLLKRQRRIHEEM